ANTAWRGHCCGAGGSSRFSATTSDPMRLRPITLREARAFVAAHHRHLGPPCGHKFSVAVEEGVEIVGVAIAGRPVSRLLDDGRTLELLRVCTQGTPNACSMLCGAVRRAAKALGDIRLVSYTLDSEPGTSLKASGWRCVAEVRAGQWGRAGRPRAACPA